MKFWIYTDADGRICATNPNDMEGNTGWSGCDNAPFSPDDPITDENGAALYKLEGGKVEVRTKEEREADWPKPEPPQPTDRERIETLEQSLDLILSGEVE